MPFFLEPYAVARTDLPTIDLSQTAPIFEIGPETDALAHWVLGADGLVDLVAGQALVEGVYAPTLNARSVTLDGRMGGGLLTPYADLPVQTVCVVVRVPATTAGTIIAGSLSATGSDGGSGLYFSGGNLAHNVRYEGGNSSAITTPLPASATAGTWVFTAASEDLDNAPGARTLFLGGGAAKSDAPLGVERTPNPTRRVALGNGFYAPWTGGIEAAELILFGSAKTVEDLTEVYARSILRGSRRAIAVI